MMKKLIVLTLAILFSLSLSAETLEVQFENANVLYKKGDFKEALVEYQRIKNEGYQQPDLFFNIGNSYYKLSDFTHAILYYEKALMLDPSNKNISYNLKMANQYIVDKVEPLPTVLVVKIKNNIKQLLNSTEWSYLSILLFLIFLLGLSLLLIYGESVKTKKLGLTIAIFSLILCITSIVIARDQYLHETRHLGAIITKPSVTVKGAPSETGTELFIIHEGIKVQITDSIEGWKEVKIPDGNTGWVPNKSMERI
ncbi:tetratricopeptide repeat protein [Halosquirtibacter xylanolyticus]|uniref:tetratricopeptide repeat protein n=1 Tax=Halosquirtibacter xylanolyticus TaxID=3374599 RepID=UPI003748A450|nr:tetratricopeptide repeat protein [Prolixibacteraceae bacterium]